MEQLELFETQKIDSELLEALWPLVSRGNNFVTNVNEECLSTYFLLKIGEPICLSCYSVQCKCGQKEYNTLNYKLGDELINFNNAIDDMVEFGYFPPGTLFLTKSHTEEALLIQEVLLYFSTKKRKYSFELKKYPPNYFAKIESIRDTLIAFSNKNPWRRKYK